MNNIVQGNICRIPFDFTFEDEVSPFRGLEVFVVYVGKIDDSGMADCIVKMLCSVRELAARMTVAEGHQVTEQNIIDAFGGHLFDYPPGLYVEHDTRYLERIFPD